MFGALGAGQGVLTRRSYHAPGMQLALPGVMGYSKGIGLVPI